MEDRGRGGGGWTCRGGASPFDEVHCILDNGQMGPPPLNRQKHTTENYETLIFIKYIVLKSFKLFEYTSKKLIIW